MRELERLRDDCLVSVLQALRTHDCGAGAVLAELRARAARRASGAVVADDDAPLRLHRAVVAPEWVDYNGHAHESRYLQVFGDATDALLRHLGVDARRAAAPTSRSRPTSRTCQARADERLHATTQLLGHDEKRLHLFHSLLRAPDDDALLATRRADAPARRHRRAARRARGRRGARAGRRDRRGHAALPRPERAGRAIGIAR